MRIANTLAIVAFTAILLPAASAVAQQQVVLTNSQASLGRIPFNPRSRSIVLSADGRHGAFVDTLLDHEQVVVDGESLEPFDRIARDSLVFSPDGSRLAYAARTGGRWYLVNRGGKVDEPFDAITGPSLRFTPDGRRLAFVASRENRWFVVHDGVAGPAFDAIDGNGRIAFSSAGRLAFVGDRAGRKVVVIDGAESMPYAEATFPVFSGDGLRAAYVGADGIKSFIVFDDFAIQAVRDGVRVHSLTLSRDGSRFAYAFRSPEGMRVSVGERPRPDVAPAAPAPALGGPAEWVFDGSITFSPDGTRVAYAIREGDQCRVVTDGKPGPPFHGVVPDTIVFSPDGRRHAYVAEQATGAGKLGRTVVVDGTAWPAFERVRGVPRFSPDGRHVACVAEHTEAGLTGQFVVVDGSCSAKAYTCLRGEPVFSPDGTRVAVMAIADDARFNAGEELPRLASANVRAGAADAGAAAAADPSGRRLVLERTDAERFRVRTPRTDDSARPLEVLLAGADRARLTRSSSESRRFRAPPRAASARLHIAGSDY